MSMLYDDVKGIKKNEVVKLRNEGRSKQVPGMLLRHGLLQVVAFMRRIRKEKPGKGDDSADELYLKLLDGAMREVLGPDASSFSLTSGYLAKQDAMTLLFLNELAFEVAEWIDRVVEAKV